MDQLKFMAPYKSVIFRAYGDVLLLAVAVLFLNVFAAALAINRKFFLKNSGPQAFAPRQAVPYRPGRHACSIDR